MIKTQVSAGLENLYELKLKINGIDMIKTQVIAGLKNLYNLDLDTSYVKLTEEGSFRPLQCLRILQLVWNKL